MKLLYAAIISLISGVIGPCAVGGEIQQPQGCKSVGRVIESFDSGIPIYSILCSDGTLVVGNSLKVKISCYGQANNRWLQGGSYSVNELCGENRSARSACWFVDCARSLGVISLISPRSSTVLETPDLIWSSIKGATAYEIRISSNQGRTIQLKTGDTRTKIPATYALESGESYLINIFATTGSEILAEGLFSIRVPEDSEVQELEIALSKIAASNLSKQEKIQLVDATYLSFGLIEHSIQYLEQASSKGNTAEVAALIADRYAEIGDSQKAQEYYEIVVEHNPETSEDVKFAKRMLTRIANLTVRAIPR